MMSPTAIWRTSTGGLALVVTLASPAFAATLTGTVVRVVDGDTVTVLDASKTQHRIRLAGIDAPERGQPFGEASRKHLGSLVAGMRVTVEWYKRDRYGRIVGKVMQGATDALLDQIRAGMAWHYKKYEREQSAEDQRLYAGAEVTARNRRFGLWVEDRAAPPWEWRKTGTRTVQ